MEVLRNLDAALPSFVASLFQWPPLALVICLLIRRLDASSRNNNKFLIASQRTKHTGQVNSAAFIVVKLSLL